MRISPAFCSKSIYSGGRSSLFKLWLRGFTKTTAAPTSPPVSEEHIAALKQFVGSCRRLVVLSGAGCSTESGIPDYRSPHQTTKHTPVQFQDYIRHETYRRRYWSRSYYGYPQMSRSQPNPGHIALAALEHREQLHKLITQNVDQLHQSAGSKRVVELHGNLGEVLCLNCNSRYSRLTIQDRMAQLNAHVPQPDHVAANSPAILIRPDGDFELSADIINTFQVPHCDVCGGVLKPNVVFFGEAVPKHVVESAVQSVREADGLLVVGSSLTVFSGYRYVLQAKEQGIPIAILNVGPTRGDGHAKLKVEGLCGEVLPKVVL